ncbi:MAG: double zinc ribbon domain-containing protein [Ruminococcus sp.]|nr:double zinc ribbon domain-containing protein [Ruminococcus sp.]MDE6784118.1 double zinc ribbon domain-containing protein [Ruminococcus sp.]
MNYRMLRHFRAIFFPVRCPVCGKIISADDRFCNECYDKLTPCTENTRIKGVSGFYALFEYTPEIKPAVSLLKNGICGNAPYAFGSCLADLLISQKADRKFSCIIPVPLHRTDIRKRGYNQAFLIAENIGRILDKKVLKDAVIKHRRTSPQKELNRAERMKNLENAFSITDTAEIHGKCILLVDDICTTGSTLTEVSKLLIENGAVEIYCAVCCKTLDMKRDDFYESR